MRSFVDCLVIVGLMLFGLLAALMAIAAMLAPIAIVAYVVLWIFGWRS